MKNSLMKTTVIFMLVSIISFSFSFIKAEGISNEYDIMPINEVVEEENKNIDQIMDTKAVEGVYKLSDDESNIYLPFIRYATDRIILDRENNSSLGSVFSATSVEVTEKQSGLKCIFASDTARINAEMDYAVIFAGQNVVIDSKINNSLVIFGGSTVTFSENSEVVGDIIVFATNLEIEGKINGSVIGFSDKVNVTGNILNDLRVECNELNIETNENIKGNIYITTYNKDLDISDKYEDAIIKFYEQKTTITKTEVLRNVSKAFIVCIVFALMFILVNNKTKLVDNCIELSKRHIMFLLLSGSLSLLLFPFIILILLIVSILNFEFIAIPILAIYIAFLLVSGLLSTFIVGSMMIKYILDNYLKKENKWMKFGFSFLTFIILYALARIPVVGSYVTWGLVMISNGIVLLRIFKNKSITNE